MIKMMKVFEVEKRNSLRKTIANMYDKNNFWIFKNAK